MSHIFSTTVPQNMTSMPRLEIRGDYAVVRIETVATIELAVRWVTGAIIEAREKGAAKLLIDASAVKGLPAPSVSDRYHYVREWAAASRGQVGIAMVLPPELIDPQKFGVMAAANAGLIMDVFTDETAALAWLSGKPAAA